MNFLLVSLLFLIWRLLDFLIIYFAPKFIPYLGFFPYKDQLPLYHLPEWISALANFDGLHYLSIAKNGYAQYQQAFFPLYPILMKFLTPLFFNNQLLTGIIISNVSFLVGLFFILKMIGGEKKGIPTARTQGALAGMNLRQNLSFLVLLLIFPTSFFFGAVYTEGLFFLLVILSLYFLKKNKYLLVIFFTLLASLTRLIGVFLIIPIIFHLIQKIKNKRPFILNVKYLLLLLSPIMGLGIYCLYLLITTGDPLFFFTSQPVFGAGRSTNLILLPQVFWRYFKIFFTASHNFQFYISLFEFSVFSFVFIILILDLFKNLKLIKNLKFEIRNFDRLGLSLFSLVNLLLPTLTGSFLSIPRFTLISLSFFIYLAEINNKYLKIIIAVIFFIFHILMLGLFRQGYFIS